MNLNKIQEIHKSTKGCILLKYKLVIYYYLYIQEEFVCKNAFRIIKMF